MIYSARTYAWPAWPFQINQSKQSRSLVNTKSVHFIIFLELLLAVLSRPRHVRQYGGHMLIVFIKNLEAKLWNKWFLHQLHTISEFVDAAICFSGGFRIFERGVADLTERYRNNLRQNRLIDSSVPFHNFKLKRPQRGGWLATQPPPPPVCKNVLRCYYKTAN